MSGRASAQAKLAPIARERRQVAHAASAQAASPQPRTQPCPKTAAANGASHTRLKPSERAEQKPSRMTQLRESGPRDHAPDVREPGIGTDGSSQRRMAEENRAPAAPLDGLRERDVVDERALDGADAADALQGLTANQYRAASRRRNARARVVHLGEGIQHLKEVDERRDERALREARAIEVHHLAYHIEPCECSKQATSVDRCRGSWTMSASVNRMSGASPAATPCSSAHILPTHPEGFGVPAQDVEIRRSAGALGGSVGGVVINQRHRERAGCARAIVLREERCDHGPDALRLVARRDHDVDAGPTSRHATGASSGARQPKPAVRGDEVDPDGERDKGSAGENTS